MTNAEAHANTARQLRAEAATIRARLDASRRYRGRIHDVNRLDLTETAATIHEEAAKREAAKEADAEQTTRDAEAHLVAKLDAYPNYRGRAIDAASLARIRATNPADHEGEWLSPGERQKRDRATGLQ